MNFLVSVVLTQALGLIVGAIWRAFDFIEDCYRLLSEICCSSRLREHVSHYGLQVAMVFALKNYHPLPFSAPLNPQSCSFASTLSHHHLHYYLNCLSVHFALDSGPIQCHHLFHYWSDLRLMTRASSLITCLGDRRAFSAWLSFNLSSTRHLYDLQNVHRVTWIGSKMVSWLDFKHRVSIHGPSLATYWISSLKWGEVEVPSNLQTCHHLSSRRTQSLLQRHVVDRESWFLWFCCCLARVLVSCV